MKQKGNIRNVLLLFILLLFLVGIECFPSPAMAQQVAYVYSTSSSVSSADAVLFKTFLEYSQYVVTPVPLVGFTIDLGDQFLEVPGVVDTNFSLFDLILVDNNTGNLDQWGTTDNTAAQVAQITAPNKPIIGIGEGGYAFFGQLGLRIGFPYGWHGFENQLFYNTSAPQNFFTGLEVSQPVIYYSSLVNSVGICLTSCNSTPDITPDVIPVGLEYSSNTHSDLVLQGSRLLWGGSGNPDLMTNDGKTLFLNSMQYMLELIPPPPPPSPFTLTYTAGLPGGTIDGHILPVTQSVNPGQNGSPVKAIPFPGYTFKNWSPGGLTDNPRTDIGVSSNITVTAIFASIDNTTTLLTQANPPGGTYNTSQTVTLAQISGQAGTIYYTTNGSDPTSSGTDYNVTPIPSFTSGTTTLRFATSSGGVWEPVKTEVYTIDSTLAGSVLLLEDGGNIPIEVKFPAIGYTIKPYCGSNIHIELFPCDFSGNLPTCDPLPSLCRIRKAYGPDDVVNIQAGHTEICRVGDMYDPSILNQLTAGSYTVKFTYANHIPINLNLNDPKLLWTGAIDLTPTENKTLSLYKFTGFLPPVDNLPVWNVAQAGRTIPIKWQLEDKFGLPWNNVATLTATVVKSEPSVFPCPGSNVEILDNIETYNDNTQSMLKCDPVTGTCQYNWKTSKDYTGFCGSFTLKLTDGTERKANFEFKTK